jgi:dTDP-4-amino-4,6-dideoxygalactose transaminase
VISVASLGAQYQRYKPAIDAAIARVLVSGTYILGSEVEAFEQAFADYSGCKYAVGVGSGTDALFLSLKALGIGPACEVITVSHTAIATVAAILAAGAVPVLADIDPMFYTLDVAALEGAISAKTRAIVPVHIYGQPAQLDAIRHFANTRGLAIIEDCAQATGGLFAGKRVGSFGDVGCFSFYPTKNLGAIGDGGMVVTNSKDVADKLRELRQYGWDAERRPQCVGVNSRLDSLQAAILAAKLPALDADNARRIELARRYHEGLRDLPIVLPQTRPNTRHVFHLYVIQCEQRDALRSHLAAAGIETTIHYPAPVHQQASYAKLTRVHGTLAQTDVLQTRIITLPLYPELGEQDVDHAIEAIRKFYRSAGSKSVARAQVSDEP